MKLFIIIIVCRSFLDFWGCSKISKANLLLCFVGVFNGQRCSTKQVTFSSCKSVLRILIYAPHEMAVLQM